MPSLEPRLGAAALLPPGEAHLYLVEDAAVAQPQIDAYRELLAPEERERWGRFHFARHRNQYVIARALVRGVLSLYKPDIPPVAWRFETNAFGRPILAAGMGEALHFNLSHTEGRIVLAVAAAAMVGVDIEWCARPGPTLELADMVFSSEEEAALRAIPAHQQRRRFFELWTLKEAYIKARGMGLSLPLKDFTMRFSGRDGLDIAFSPGRQDAPAHWSFFCLDAGPDYALALALAGKRRWQPRLFHGVPLQPFAEADCRILRSTAP